MISLKKEMVNGISYKDKAFTIGLDLSPQLIKVGEKVLDQPLAEVIDLIPHMREIKFSYNL